MSEFLLGGVLFFVHYNGKYWYLYFRWGVLYTASYQVVHFFFPGIMYQATCTTSTLVLIAAVYTEKK